MSESKKKIIKGGEKLGKKGEDEGGINKEMGELLGRGKRGEKEEARKEGGKIEEERSRRGGKRR